MVRFVRIERRARRIRGGVAVLAVVLLAAACSKTSTPAAAPTTAGPTSTTTTTAPPAAPVPARPATQWDAVEAHIGADGQLDLAGTRLAFSLLFRPLPGVTLPTGAETSDLRSNGSMVARAVLQHWDELSVADRRIMAPYFSPTGPGSTGLATTGVAGPGSGGAATTTTAASGPTSPTTTTAPSGATTTSPTAPTTGGRSARIPARHTSAIRGAVPPPDNDSLDWTSDQVWSIAQREAGLLGVNAPPRTFFEVRFSSSDLLTPKGKKEEADLWTVVLADKREKLDPAGTQCRWPTTRVARPVTASSSCPRIRGPTCRPTVRRRPGSPSSWPTRCSTATRGTSSGRQT